MIDGLNLKPGTSSQETDDDEMPPLIAFDDDQTKEQGPEQEQGTTVAERMEAHYKEQEEKFYKNELRKKVADLRRIQEHEKHILKFNEEFVARIEAMRQSHINYIEKEYKARIEVMDEMKKAFQVRRDRDGSNSRSSGSA